MAQNYYKKAVQEDPLLDKGWIAIANLYIKGKKYNKSLFYINKALEIDDQNAHYWRKYAEINLKLSYFEEAAIAFQQCILLKDSDLVIWIGLSDVLCFLGEFEDALTNLLKAKLFFNDFAEIEYRLASLYFKFKNYPKGTLHLETALSIDFEYHSIIKELFPEVYKLQKVKDIIAQFK